MIDKLPVPIELTDAELDAVAAGQVIGNLVGIQVGDVNVAVPVTAAVSANVAVGLLSNIVQGAASNATGPGMITQA